MVKNKSKYPQPDKSVIRQCQKGNTMAFNHIVDTTRELAYKTAVSILLNEDDAKDALQDAYIKAWNNIGQYNFKNLFTTWFYRILTNCCIDRLRSKKDFEGINDINLDTQSDLETNIINSDYIKQIKKLSQGLPYKQRITFILCDLQNLSLSEAATILNIKSGVVKSNLYYARKHIKDILLKLDKRRVENEVC